MRLQGAIFVAALAVAHVPLINRIPQVAPYVLVAGLVAYLALADLALCLGYRIADERAALRQLKIDLAWSKNQLAQQKATAEDKERLAAEKAAEADELKAKVDDYEKTLSSRPVGDCALDDVDLDGLRSLRRRATKHKR